LKIGVFFLLDLTYSFQVYNCRTPNSWPSDLALSATYYPGNGFTFAILYGTSPSLEKEILRRLRFIGEEAAHPLLIPGILAELELARHTRLVESSINTVEAKIFELNFQSGGSVKDFDRSTVENRQQAKRTAWLDLTYLRNSLTTWTAQLLVMAEHANVLNEKTFVPRNNDSALPVGPQHAAPAGIVHNAPPQTQVEAKISRSDKRPGSFAPGPKVADENLISWKQDQEIRESNFDHSPHEIYFTKENENTYIQRMRNVGAKIRSRLAAMIDECDEKVRDCTMRVDGMAMATQWSNSETVVEVALATNQDSKVMKSISLVTMVFLPGTFFATVFSMTFFDWFGYGGKAQVSGYLWIYVVVTVFFTAITIGLWYYFVIFRRSGRKISDEEKVIID
jgi:hypothetical protein